MTRERSTRRRGVDPSRADPARAGWDRPPARCGQALDAATRGYMEARFGHNFADVRVHADASADATASRLGARALAVGDDVYFRAGRYAPDTLEGRRLLAHELTHVVQSDRGAPADAARVSRPGDGAEAEARAASAAVLTGAPVSVTSGAGAGVALEGEHEESWLERAAWFAGEHLPGVGYGVEGVHHALEAGNAHDPLDAIHSGAEALLSPISGALDLAEFSIFGAGGLLGEGSAIGTALGTAGLTGEGGALATLAGAYETGGLTGAAGSLLGAGGLVPTLTGAFGAGGAEAVAGTIMPSVFGAAEGAAVLPGVAGMAVGDIAAAGGTALLGSGAAVAGAGLAGWTAGRALDGAVDWVGDQVTGNEQADHSISGALGDGLFGALGAGPGLWLADHLPSWLQ